MIFFCSSLGAPPRYMGTVRMTWISVVYSFVFWSSGGTFDLTGLHYQTLYPPGCCIHQLGTRQSQSPRSTLGLPSAGSCATCRRSEIKKLIICNKINESQNSLVRLQIQGNQTHFPTSERIFGQGLQELKILFIYCIYLKKSFPVPFHILALYKKCKFFKITFYVPTGWTFGFESVTNASPARRANQWAKGTYHHNIINSEKLSFHIDLIISIIYVFNKISLQQHILYFTVLEASLISN